MRDEYDFANSVENTYVHDKDSFPARLHVVFARDKRVGVVFRRGPSKQVATYLWNREQDSFELGQWLKGRIYERRSDLSPDGKYLIYFAMNGKWDTNVKGAWTAISIAPWLHAINLYAKGDCWNGGGLFTSNSSFWLNDGCCGHNIIRESEKLTKDKTNIYDNAIGNNEDLGVYYNRLLRDDWKITEENNDYTIFEKPLSHDWFLIKIAHTDCNSPVGSGCYWDEHQLYNRQSKITIECEGWEWAEKDTSFLVWAKNGCLYRVKIDKDIEIDNAIKLYDFNKCRFKAIKAPY